MKFSTNEDIDAPTEAVFDMFSDFDTFERAAIRRGAEVRRLDRMPTPGPGMTWHAAFDMRGKRRQMEVEMVTFDRPHQVILESTSPGMLGTTVLEMTALSQTRTRLHVELELKPLNLSARLLVQSLKLAKNSLTTKFKLSVAKYARQVEGRYSR